MLGFLFSTKDQTKKSTLWQYTHLQQKQLLHFRGEKIQRGENIKQQASKYQRPLKALLSCLHFAKNPLETL